jgi:hypothetical protein
MLATVHLNAQIQTILTPSEGTSDLQEATQDDLHDSDPTPEPAGTLLASRLSLAPCDRGAPSIVRATIDAMVPLLIRPRDARGGRRVGQMSPVATLTAARVVPATARQEGGERAATTRVKVLP